MPKNFRPRPKTDLYLAAGDRALATPGAWTSVRIFETQKNAAVTASCMRGGYLRVKPREDEVAVQVGRHRWLRLSAPLETRIDEIDEGWHLSVRFSPRRAEAQGATAELTLRGPLHEADKGG